MGVRLLRPRRAGADLPLRPIAMTFTPFAPAFLAVGLLVAGVGVVGPFLPASARIEPGARQQRLAPPPPPVPAAPGELKVPADSVLGLQLETLVTTRPEAGDERVVASVTRDVMVGGQVAVPTGARVLGTARLVEKGPKGKETARLEIRFDTLELPSGERVEIETEPVVRDAGSRVPSLARLGGGAAGGAAVGAILGGGKGAAIGGVLGAAGAAATGPGREDVVELRPGTVLSVRTKGDFRVGTRDEGGVQGRD